MSIEVIKPREITGKILTLIEEAVDEVTIVSPYIDISRWIKVKQALKRAKKRGVRIIVYLREDQAPSTSMIEPFADSIHLVERLHAKLYINSTTAVFTSMNLVQTSDEKSTDLGIFTTNQAILSSFADFINTYLKPLAKQGTELSAVNSQLPEESKTDFDPNFHKKLGVVLKNTTPGCSWVDGRTYWFSGDAASAGDLMISEKFIWKLRKNSNGTNKDADWFIRTAKKNFKDGVDIVLDTEHSSNIYVEVYPISESKRIETLIRLLNHVRYK